MCHKGSSNVSSWLQSSKQDKGSCPFPAWRPLHPVGTEWAETCQPQGLLVPTSATKARERKANCQDTVRSWWHLLSFPPIRMWSLRSSLWLHLVPMPAWLGPALHSSLSRWTTSEHPGQRQPLEGTSSLLLAGRYRRAACKGIQEKKNPEQQGLLQAVFQGTRQVLSYSKAQITHPLERRCSLA